MADAPKGVCMAQVTADVTKRLSQLPHDLQAEFPNVPFAAIVHDVDVGTHELLASARFDNYIPLLAHRAVRERLRTSQPSAAGGLN
jgi:hypothetical protein